MAHTSRPENGTTTLSETDFAVPPGDRYFEHYVPGCGYEYGSRLTAMNLLLMRDAA